MPLDQGKTQVISALTGNTVLIWVKEDGSEVRFPIIAPVTTIGREPANMIPLNETTVSRFHAKLIYQNGHYLLMDLGSANKTFVNGHEIKETRLQSGCDIRFGGCRFKFQEVQPAVPPHAVTPVSAAAPSGVTPAPLKKKPKPIVILGSVFVLLIVLLSVVVKLTNTSGPSTPAAGEKKQATEPAPPPVTVAPSPATTPVSSMPPAPGATQAPGGIPGTAPLTSSPASGLPATPSAPPSASRLLDEAAISEASGRLRDARLKYEQALHLEPGNSRARSKIESLKPMIEDAINLHFRNAKQAFDYLRYDEAIDEWNLVISLAEPSDARYVDSQRGIQQAQSRLKR